jgi:hypothetical protein
LDGAIFAPMGAIGRTIRAHPDQALNRHEFFGRGRSAPRRILLIKTRTSYPRSSFW